MTLPEGGFLNDVQYAFLIGKQSGSNMCGCSCHVLAEYHCSTYEEEKLCQAWAALGERHLILHSVIADTGEVTFETENHFPEKLHIYDYRLLSPEEAEHQYTEMKQFYSSRNMCLTEGEVFLLHCFQMPDGTCYLCFEGDCIAYDITSFQIFIKDFSCFYAGGELEALPAQYNPYAPEFILKADSAQKKADRTYWKEQVNSFGEFPAKQYLDFLPYRPHYSAHVKAICSEDYQELIQKAESYHVSAEIFLLSLFSKAISECFKTEHFVLNLPILDRKTIPEEFRNVGADFTILMMLDIKITDSFEMLLDRINRQYQENLSHSSLSGVKVQNLLKKSENVNFCDYHITFSSHIHEDMETEEIRNSIGKFCSIMTQTPKVLIDSEFFTVGNGLFISLVTPDSVLEDGKEEQILTAFQNISEKILKGEENI